MRKRLHDWLGIVYPKGTVGCDGLSLVCECEFCDRVVIMDSWGCWFHGSRLVQR